MQYAEWSGAEIYQLKCLQYDWALDFPDYARYSAKNLSIDLRKSISHGSSMYTLSINLL